MNTIIEKLKEMLVVPVVVLDDVKDAEKLADALVGCLLYTSPSPRD